MWQTFRVLVRPSSFWRNKVHWFPLASFSSLQREWSVDDLWCNLNAKRSLNWLACGCYRLQGQISDIRSTFARVSAEQNRVTVSLGNILSKRFLDGTVKKLALFTFNNPHRLKRISTKRSSHQTKFDDTRWIHHQHLFAVPCFEFRFQPPTSLRLEGNSSRFNITHVEYYSN